MLRSGERMGKREKAEGERKLQKLDEKTVASLPAAAILNANEKLMDLFARGKKRGKLDSSEMLDVLPSHSVVVEDAYMGIEAAVRGGFVPVAIGNDASKHAGAAYRVSCLSELIPVLC